MTGCVRRMWLITLVGCALPLGLVILAASGCSEPATTLEQPGTEQPTPEQPTPEQPTPEQPTPEQPTPEQPTPEQPTPEQPTPEQPTPEQPTPEQPTPEQPTPEQPGGTPAADPNAPPVSSFAPAEDLVAQLAEYVEDLEDTLADESEYADFKDKVVQDACTVAVIALALGLHDQDNAYRDSAAAIVTAAQQLAEAGDYAAATQALAAVKEAVAGGSDPPGDLKWEPVASLEALMKHVPLVNTKLKRYTSGSRFESKAADSAGFSAVLAAIAQASLPDTHEAENEEQAEQWRRFCIQMRDAAGAVNAGIKAQDLSVTEAAMQALAQSCDDCHAVFKPEEH